MQFRFFPAFFDHPIKIRFSEQEPDEVIELLLRRHFITNLSWILIAIIAYFIPFLVFAFRDLIGLGFIRTLPLQLQLATLTVWDMLVTAYVIENLLSWYFNIYIVTNNHIVDVDFESLLSRNVTEANITDVESASADIRGLFQSFFNFGNVVIETAAKGQSEIFELVPYPDKVIDRINDLKDHLQGGGQE